jgi:hypothetical protein
MGWIITRVGRAVSKIGRENGAGLEEAVKLDRGLNSRFLTRLGGQARRKAAGFGMTCDCCV